METYVLTKHRLQASVYTALPARSTVSESLNILPRSWFQMFASQQLAGQHCYGIDRVSSTYLNPNLGRLLTCMHRI
jgi:hypothetical protein